MECIDSNVYANTQRKSVVDKIEPLLQTWALKWLGESVQDIDFKFNRELFGSVVIPAQLESIECEASGLMMSEEACLEVWLTAALGKESQISEDVKLAYSKQVFDDLKTCIELPKKSASQLACMIKLTICGQSLFIICDVSWMREMVTKPSSAPEYGLLEALDREPVNLEAKLSASSVPLKEVVSLLPGNVLALDQLVSSPLTLSVKGKNEIASGYLVAMNGMKSFLVESGK